MNCSLPSNTRHHPAPPCAMSCPVSQGKPPPHRPPRGPQPPTSSPAPAATSPPRRPPRSPQPYSTSPPTAPLHTRARTLEASWRPRRLSRSAPRHLTLGARRARGVSPAHRRHLGGKAGLRRLGSSGPRRCPTSKGTRLSWCRRLTPCRRLAARRGPTPLRPTPRRPTPLRPTPLRPRLLGRGGGHWR